jgi:hypothetical protein
LQLFLLLLLLLLLHCRLFCCVCLQVAAWCLPQ